MYCKHTDLFSDFGVVLGCKFFIKELYHGSLAREEGNLHEGDTVLKVNVIYSNLKYSVLLMYLLRNKP